VVLSFLFLIACPLRFFDFKGKKFCIDVSSAQNEYEKRIIDPLCHGHFRVGGFPKSNSFKLLTEFYKGLIKKSIINFVQIICFARTVLKAVCEISLDQLDQ